jgi:hypothetical protein
MSESGLSLYRALTKYQRLTDAKSSFHSESTGTASHVYECACVEQDVLVGGSSEHRQNRSPIVSWCSSWLFHLVKEKDFCALRLSDLIIDREGRSVTELYRCVVMDECQGLENTKPVTQKLGPICASQCHLMESTSRGTISTLD